jgi:hypothetical protein
LGGASAVPQATANIRIKPIRVIDVFVAKLKPPNIRNGYAAGPDYAVTTPPTVLMNEPCLYQIDVMLPYMEKLGVGSGWESWQEDGYG